jgi:hypothetical protein
LLYFSSHKIFFLTRQNKKAPSYPINTIMAFIKLNPRTLLLFITTTAISLGVVCGDVGKLRGQLSKGMKYVAKVNEQKILITKDEPSQINDNANANANDEAPIPILADRTGMSADDIRSSIHKSFDDVLNQK